MNSSPLLSVIIPVYNIAPYLERCLDSVIHQTYTNLEIIVVNDGSTDSSAEIIARCAAKDSRILVVHKNNEGVVIARQTGIERATGEYIHYLDGDDYLELEAYENLIPAIEETQADVLLFDFWFEEEQSGKKDKSESHSVAHYRKEDFLNRIFLNGGYFAVWTYLHRRSLYDCGIQPATGISIGEDAIQTAQIVYYAENIQVYQGAPLLHYLIRKGSALTSALSTKKIADFIEFPQRIIRFFQDKPIYPALSKSLGALKIQSFNHVIHSGYLQEVKRMSQEAMDLYRAYPELKRQRPTRTFYKLYYYYSLSPLLGTLYARYYRHKGKIRNLDIQPL